MGLLSLRTRTFNGRTVCQGLLRWIPGNTGYRSAALRSSLAGAELGGTPTNIRCGSLVSDHPRPSYLTCCFLITQTRKHLSHTRRETKSAKWNSSTRTPSPQVNQNIGSSAQHLSTHSYQKHSADKIFREQMLMRENTCFLVQHP
jgi:hypothetical protein